jgi:membrane protein DedA with SNARE-associated domain
VRPVTHLVLTYGYLAVFGLITAEYIGVPVPGETALIVAAAYAGHTHRPAAPGGFRTRGR